MKLTGDLRDKVFNTDSLEERRDIIAQAGMELTDDELEVVAGGMDEQEAMRVIEETRQKAWQEAMQEAGLEPHEYSHLYHNEEMINQPISHPDPNQPIRLTGPFDTIPGIYPEIKN